MFTVKKNGTHSFDAPKGCSKCGVTGTPMLVSFVSAIARIEPDYQPPTQTEQAKAKAST